LRIALEGQGLQAPGAEGFMPVGGIVDMDLNPRAQLPGMFV